MTVNCILERVTETRSTNDDLLERWRSGQLIYPVARIAHNQTAGKGRAGRTWLATPENSICFSLAFPFQRTPAELSGLSLLVGLAVISGIAQAIELSEDHLYKTGLRLKWPNDLLLNNGKVGGILIEGGQANSNEPSWMIIGVGLNLCNSGSIASILANGQKVGSIDQIISESKKLPDTEYLWLKLIASFEHYLKQFDQYGFEFYQEEWKKWDAYLNQSVCISTATGDPIYGIAKGIDKTGALILQQEHKTILIHAGDVSLRAQS
jgi:BirA family transcriptional regulator, biotin operon repressor / biotin---[acetyl-CoA-carboxylase] ligase